MVRHKLAVRLSYFHHQSRHGGSIRFASSKLLVSLAASLLALIGGQQI